MRVVEQEDKKKQRTEAEEKGKKGVSRERKGNKGREQSKRREKSQRHESIEKSEEQEIITRRYKCVSQAIEHRKREKTNNNLTDYNITRTPINTHIIQTHNK